jgi:hypothetical protein
MIRDLLCVITSVVNLWSEGRCRMSLGDFVVSITLTHLIKHDGRIHHIVVGTFWRRLISKISLKSFDKDVAKYLHDFQFGVRVSGYIVVQMPFGIMRAGY